MSYKNFTLDIDTDGLALVTWDMPDKSMNVIDLSVMDELEAIVEKVAGDEAIKGAVVTSGKDAFSGGADLKMLEGLLGQFEAEKRELGHEEAARHLFEGSRRLTLIFRKLETSKKPWVAALNGTAMGGAFELALACHARIAADKSSTKVGLPEIKVGLFPGAGGTTRILRMMDTQNGMQMLLQGKTLDLKKAKGFKLVDVVVPADDLIGEAKALLKAGVDPVKPWDKKGYRLPSGRVYSPAGFQLWPAAGAIYRRETHDNYPAARALLRAAYEGLLLEMDDALKVESRYFAHVLQTKEAASMIRSLFVSMQDLNKLARRPKDVAKTALTKVGVLGAGFMGAGVAYVSARAGLEVVLIDREQEAADKGKAYADEVMSKYIARGRGSEEEKQVVLGRITATTDYQALEGCDLVIEAVFEDRDVKAGVTKEAEAVLGENAVFASNTSTLPITSLAQNSVRPERFIGIHFFSPVDKMMLVEVIMGKETGDEALATALDYCRIIKKTPIVVNDSRGFYVNRPVTAYVREAHLMLMEGVPAPMIDNLARQAGMPVGPLALNDEVALDLARKILQATKKDLGEAAVDPRQEKLLEEMVVRQERLGRKNSKGFYDYQGKNKRLWPGLADLQETRLDADSIDHDEIKDRFLVMMALEAARCFEEGVLTDIREADVGSILGFGFAPYSGGTLSYIDNMGLAEFVARAEELAERYGDRFTPPALVKEMAANGETFYGRFSPDESAEAA
ncbi:3-hydroxyacyl-CoA dehydrogenase NAD-binding domain-containing protein [Coralliovum pocilloporae]|uniref:3-hydroxyacyl-CoA dehydrogenase NAD-binding domain-containing protein n=1 Tax=Coralliovum pocilloporae TaxID=3066369 RepID=UPI003306D1C4